MIQITAYNTNTDAQNNMQDIKHLLSRVKCKKPEGENFGQTLSGNLQIQNILHSRQT